MSETWKQKVSRVPGTGGLAVASVSLSSLGLAVIAWRLLAYRPWWSEYVARNITGLFGTVGLILGYVALRRISKRTASITLLVLSSPLLLVWFSFIFMGMLRSRAIYGYTWLCSSLLLVALLVLILSVMSTPPWKSWLKGKAKTGTLAALRILVSVSLARAWWVETCRPVSTALRMVCGHNLKRIGDAMKAYADENEARYPDPNQWCDLLLQHTDVDTDWFLCPAAKFRWRRQVFPFPIPKCEGCYYAVNPGCEPNSPDDTVLLFEIAGGWNKSGGQELLSSQNHEDDGCGVVFADGRTDFISTKEFAALNWGIREETE